MDVDIINSPKSKFTYESEVKTLWVSLLFAQSVVLGGRSTFRMALENYLKTASEKAKIATLQGVIDNWFDEEIQRDFAKDVNDYKMHVALKQKSKKDLLLLTIDRWGFKIHQDLVVKTNRDYLQNVKLLNLFPLVSDNRTGIYNLYFNNSSKDKIRYAVIIIKGLKDNFILDKTIFDNVPAIDMNETDQENAIKALSLGEFTFLYGELMSLPLLYDITTDRFNAVREYFIKGSESFDETFFNFKKVFFPSEN